MKIVINVVHKMDDQLVSKLNYIIKQNHEIMTKQERFDAILGRINIATNNIAEDQRRLLDEIRQGTVSEESLAKAEANADLLDKIAADVADPVPPTEGEEEVPPAEETEEPTV